MVARGIEPELLVEGIRGAQLKPVVLSARAATSEIARLVFPTAALDMARLGPQMQFTGAMDRGHYTLLFVRNCSLPCRALNFSVEHGPGFLGMFPPGGDVDGITAPGFDQATLTVPASVFHDSLERCLPELPESCLRTGAGIDVRAPEQARLRQILGQVDQLLSSSPAFLGDRAVLQHLERDLTAAFLGALRSGFTAPGAARTGRIGDRMTRLRRARDFLAAHAHAPVYLDDLCRELGLSQRGVEKLFREVLGLSPLTYLRHHRLHGARRALLEAEPASGIVKQVALDWGFWHLGNFAGDYRQLFGESPSATLQRTRRTAPVWER